MAAAYFIRRHLRRSTWLQIGVLVGVWALAKALVDATHIPLPAGVVGLFVVLALFASGAVRVVSLRRGARRLLHEMLLFFVPASLALLDHREYLGVLGVKILTVIVVGTVVVMTVTALVVETALRISAGVRRGVD